MKEIKVLSIKVTGLFFLIGALCIAFMALPWYIPFIILGIMYFLVRNVLLCIRDWILDNLTIEDEG